MGDNNDSLTGYTDARMGMTRTVSSLGRAVALALAVGMLGAGPAAAQDKAGKNQPSDRTVRVIVSLAWSLVPEKDKVADGEEVTIDKSSPKKYMIPMGDARRIIKIANRTAKAAKCRLPELEVMNHRQLLSNEKDRGKWTEEQLYFIHRVHLTTVIVATGNIGDKRATGSVGDKKKQAQSGSDVKTIGDSDEDQAKANGGAQEEPANPEYNCTSDEREQVKKQIEAYLKAKG